MTAPLATSLNKGCFCISLDDHALYLALESELGQPGLFQLVRERCPYLFAARPVFISREQRERMAAVVQAVESVVSLPAWRELTLAQAPAIARVHPGHSRGAFLGYDFHVHNNQLGLIEINTNAGGAMLNAVLARAQRACCEEVDTMLPTLASVQQLEASIIAMFRKEWALDAQERPLRRIAIVDEHPQQQYLYPEFLLFQQLFQRHDIDASIVAPEELQFVDGKLRHGDSVIDLVYNRLTDFALEDANNAVLRDAWLAGAITLTPHPQAHALYADKRNLALLTDPATLQALGVSAATQAVLLENIPHTEVVNPADAERLWSQRRQLFFKPNAGYGSRAAYRGDKLTKRVWEEILQGDYVAQALITPGERTISDAPDTSPLKFDLRNYAYHGEVQWLAARLYQGQTTNFRTPGGGFAPVYSAG
jgi:hypothetical protein